MTRPAADVIGGGPAGLMAAEVLATGGMAVRVHEHMPSVGRKLLLAGRSGLNLTHAEPFAELLDRYGDAAPRLERALREFGPDEVRAWCAGLGEATFVGSTGRVFPTAMRATPLLRAWLRRLAALGVTIRLRERWSGWARTADGALDPRRATFVRSDGECVESRSDVTVLALGGATWPRVGSDGGWVDVLRGAGVAVTALRPANCGLHVRWSPAFANRCAGAPLKNVAISAGGRTVRGDATITTTGIESGPVYPLSSTIRDALDRDGRAAVTIDLHPDLDVAAIAARLARRRPKDSLASALRRTLGLGPVQVGLLRESTGNDVPGDAAALAALVKAVPLDVRAVMPIERAISTAGGVALDEVDESFMLRRLPGVYVVGEMLDWEAPTGGYLLQATLSTAVAASRAAVARSRGCVA